MNNRLLLITCISLMYRESQLSGPKEKSSDIIKEVLSKIKVPDSTLSLDPETKVVEGLRKVTQWMLDNPLDYQYQKNELLQKIIIISQDDDSIIDGLRVGIHEDLDDRTLKQTCVNYRITLKDVFREERLAELLAKSSGKMKFDRPSIDNVRQFARELVAELEPYTQDFVTVDPAVVSEVDFSLKESVTAVYEAIQKEAGGESIMYTGWQDINDMLQGGFRRGEQWVIGALQHKYKTGFTLNLFKHLAMYNTPFMLDQTKKPIIIRISFEDDIQLNMRFLYRSLYENAMKQKLTDEQILNMEPGQISNYVIAELRKTGYDIRMYRVDPTKWTYLDLINQMLKLEAEGYEIHAVVVDYLKMLPTTGCTGTTAGEDIRDMFRRLRNFTSPRKILFITPHQLSTEAKQLVRDGQTEFVKQVAEKGYFDGCKRLDNEVDGELYIHIEKYSGESFLTVQRGKHRLDSILPDEKKYIVYKFEDIGGIPDDFGKEQRLGRKKVGGGLVGSVNENPYWTMDI